MSRPHEKVEHRCTDPNSYGYWVVANAIARLCDGPTANAIVAR